MKNLPANLNYKIKHATTGVLFFLIKEMSIQEARIKLKELLANPTRENKYAAAATLPEIIKEMPSLSFETFTFFKERITNHNSNDIGYSATIGIAAMAEVNPSLAKEAFIILRNLLNASFVFPVSRYS